LYSPEIRQKKKKKKKKKKIKEGQLTGQLSSPKRRGREKNKDTDARSKRTSIPFLPSTCTIISFAPGGGIIPISIIRNKSFSCSHVNFGISTVAAARAASSLSSLLLLSLLLC
jgi:hypothetical protein